MPKGIYNRKPVSKKSKQINSEAQKKYFAKMTKEERAKRFKNFGQAGWRTTFLAEVRDKKSKARKGMKFSEEWRHNIGQDSAKRFAKMTKEQKLKYLKHWILAGQIASQKANPSSIEKMIWRELDKLGIEYETQVRFASNWFIVDIYISIWRLIIECNGTFWHNYEMFPKKKIRDDVVDKWAVRNGYKIIWLWEDDIRKNPEQALKDGFSLVGIDVDALKEAKQSFNVTIKRKNKL